jgi:hypothetical protein
MPFERFLRTNGTPVPQAPSMRVSKARVGRTETSSCLFRLTSEALAHIGTPDHLAMLVDREGRLLAFEPLQSKEHGSYGVSYSENAARPVGQFRSPVLARAFEVKIPMANDWEIPVDVSTPGRLVVDIGDLIEGESRLQAAIRND